MIRELGEDYTARLRRLYEGRVPGGADLVCYWFEKARTAIKTQGLGAAGLVATNSIRGGANRKVLDAIVLTSRIYEAWDDVAWINDGAAVRVSLVAFGHADQPARLNGKPVASVAADLHAHQANQSADLTTAQKLAANAGASFIGTQKNGPFDVPRQQAVKWLNSPNPHRHSNAVVLKPWANGLTVTRRPDDTWIIDFDKMSENEASLFEQPFDHVDKLVKPTRMDLRRDWHRTHWWCHGDPRPAMKAAVRTLPRQIITPRVSKHRVFAWFHPLVLADSAVVCVTRADDTTFGILHSRFHELWSLRMGTSLEDRPRYTPTTCFETFPFPAGLTPADTATSAPRRWRAARSSPLICLSNTEPKSAASPYESMLCKALWFQ
jgi:type II restriction/modification system DNA methylase subunit YeeA